MDDETPATPDGIGRAAGETGQTPDAQRIAHLVSKNPASAEPGHQIDEHAWRTLGALQRMDRAAMEDGARSLTTVSRELLGRAVDDVGHNAPTPWLAWYGGQMQGLAAVLRCALLQQLPQHATAIRGKKNALAILGALTDKAQNLSALCERCGISDLSQMGREVDLLVEAGLVTTMKMGNKRWVSLTPLGQQAVEPHLQSMSQVPGKDPPRGMHAGDGGRGANRVRDIWSKKAVG